MKTLLRSNFFSHFFSGLFVLPLFFILNSSPSAHADDVWHGHTETSPIEVGVLTGTALYGSNTSWGVLGTAAYLINKNGFIDTIDDRVWVEIEMGPTFFSQNGMNSTGLQYNAHLRWDFTYNEYWNFYALGGFGGFVLPNFMGGDFTLHPRFGGGVEYQTKTALLFRAELTPDFMGLGIALNF